MNLKKNNLKKNFKYKWIKVGSIKFDSNVICLCWNIDNNRLLIGLKNGSIQIWSYDSNLSNILHEEQASSMNSQLNIPPHASKLENQVKFSIDEETDTQLNEEVTNSESAYKKKSNSDQDLLPRVLLKKIWEKR